MQLRDTEAWRKLFLETPERSCENCAWYKKIELATFFIAFTLEAPKNHFAEHSVYLCHGCALNWFSTLSREKKIVFFGKINH